VVPINFFNAEGAEKVDEMEDRLLSDRGVIPISECECVHVICPNKFIGRFKEMHERYGVEVRFYRKYADLVSLRNWVTLDDMIRGASEISTGKYSTIVDVHGSGEVYRELGLAISSYLGNREVNFDLGLVRGYQVSYLGPLTTLLVSFSLLTLVTHTYEELTNTVEPEKKEVVSKKDSSGKEEKYIYQKWGVTITSKDDGRMDNGKMAALWRVLRGKLESDTTLFLFAIFPMYGLAARRAFRKVNFGSYPLMAGAHYMALVYLYTLFALLPLPVWAMVYYLVWTYRGIYGMTWLRTIRYKAFTACWVVLYLFLLLVALALLGIGIVYLINFLFFT
jgi:hypothetical protein